MKALSVVKGCHSRTLLGVVWRVIEDIEDIEDRYED